MINLRKLSVMVGGLLAECSYPLMALLLIDLATNASDEVAAYAAHARRAQEEFNFDGRIVGGFATSIANYPYQVSLQYHKSHICGGSIVAQNIILTAAHCIEEPWDTAAFRVRAGSSTHLFGGQLVDVRHIFKHEAYSSSTLDSDVALVVLKTNLTYTRTVRPIELAAGGEHLPSSANEFIATGWGLTSETGVVSPILNYVALRLINQTTCSKNYQFIAEISANMFCAGDPQGGKDSCQGDSGGPLVSYVQTAASTTQRESISPAQEQQTNALKPKQYGIVSWGVGCAEKNYPGVYANVAALRPWLDEKLKQVRYL